MLNAATKTTNRKVLIYGCGPAQKCYETTQHSGVLVHGILDCMTKNTSNAVTIAQLKGHTFIGVFEHCHAKELGDQGFARVVARSIRDDKFAGKKHYAVWALGKLLTYFAPTIGLFLGPALLPLGCMMAPLLVLLASLVCSNYSYILAQTFLPTIVNVVFVLMSGGYISADHIMMIPSVLFSCMLCAWVVSFHNMRKERTMMRFITRISGLLVNVGDIIISGQVARDGIYTGFGVNMSAMATFKNGYTVIYQPMNSTRGYECIVPTGIQNKKLVMSVLTNETNYIAATKSWLATCKHDIFRNEVQYRMNVSSAINSEFGELSLLSIGNITLNMSAYDETKKKYMVAAGVFAKKSASASDAELTQILEDIRKNAHDSSMPIVNIPKGTWVEPEDNWFVNFYALSGVKFFTKHFGMIKQCIDFLSFGGFNY